MKKAHKFNCLLKSRFSRMERAANAARRLGPEGSLLGCPNIEYWLFC
jgi:hypothetical protein